MTKIMLTADEFETLVDRLQDVDPEGHPHPQYSGRGMFGRTCFGWSTHAGSGAVHFALAAIVVRRDYVGDNCNPSVDDVLDAVASAMDEVGAPSQDGMGRAVIYYWRNVRVDPDMQPVPEDRDEEVDAY